MTGRKSGKAQKRRKAKPQQQEQQAQAGQQQPQQPADEAHVGPSSPPTNIKVEQPPPQQIVKKILKAETDEAKTLKTVFKSNPDAQMKEFIKKAGTKPSQQAINKAAALKTPAENHPPAVAQELLETDDDVADNLGKLFKASKSFKNL